MGLTEEPFKILIATAIAFMLLAMVVVILARFANWF